MSIPENICLNNIQASIFGLLNKARPHLRPPHRNNNQNQVPANIKRWATHNPHFIQRTMLVPLGCFSGSGWSRRWESSAAHLWLWLCGHTRQSSTPCSPTNTKPERPTKASQILPQASTWSHYRYSLNRSSSLSTQVLYDIYMPEDWHKRREEEKGVKKERQRRREYLVLVKLLLIFKLRFSSLWVFCWAERGGRYLTIPCVMSFGWRRKRREGWSNTKARNTSMQRWVPLAVGPP